MARTAHGWIYLGIGAALMYLMDPQQGRKRRNDLAKLCRLLESGPGRGSMSRNPGAQGLGAAPA